MSVSSMLRFMIFATLFCYTSLVQAKTPNETLALGIGVKYDNLGYRSLDREITPFPFIHYEDQRFFVRGLEFGLHLQQTKTWSLDALAKIRLEGFAAEDSDFFQGMNDRDNALEVGLSLGYQLPAGKLNLSLLADASATHEGREIKVSYAYPQRKGNWLIFPKLHVEHQSDDLANYYFGVHRHEATEARSVYAPGASLNYGVGLTLGYYLSKQHEFYFDSDYSIYDSAIKNSPIVEDSNSIKFRLRYAYRFW